MQQAALDRVKGPLTPQEMAHIETALRYYGRQLNRWELIVAQFMPYRTATQLSRLWGIHLKAKEAVAALTSGAGLGSYGMHQEELDFTEDDVGCMSWYLNLIVILYGRGELLSLKTPGLLFGW